jgi:hypothetical protein
MNFHDFTHGDPPSQEYGFCAFETCIIKTEILIFLLGFFKYIDRYFVPDIFLDQLGVHAVAKKPLPKSRRQMKSTKLKSRFIDIYECMKFIFKVLVLIVPFFFCFFFFFFFSI